MFGIFYGKSRTSEGHWDIGLTKTFKDIPLNITNFIICWHVVLRVWTSKYRIYRLFSYIPTSNMVNETLTHSCFNIPTRSM